MSNLAPIGPLVRDVVIDIDRMHRNHKERDYLVTVVTSDAGRLLSKSYTVRACCWYRAWEDAADKYGIAMIVKVRPIAETPQKELPLCAA